MDESGSRLLAVLGLGPEASKGDVRAARTALVKALHPDVLGHEGPQARAAAERRLAEVNAAYDSLVAHWCEQDGAAGAGHGTQGDPLVGPVTFTVGAFRPAAFEALVVAAGDVGDVTDSDEPFSLEVHVEGPPTGFCRLELFPEAGGSVVTVESEVADPTWVAQMLVVALRGLGFPAELTAT